MSSLDKIEGARAMWQITLRGVNDALAKLEAIRSGIDPEELAAVDKQTGEYVLGYADGAQAAYEAITNAAEDILTDMAKYAPPDE